MSRRGTTELTLCESTKITSIFTPTDSSVSYRGCVQRCPSIVREGFVVRLLETTIDSSYETVLWSPNERQDLRQDIPVIPRPVDGRRRRRWCSIGCRYYRGSFGWWRPRRHVRWCYVCIVKLWWLQNCKKSNTLQVACHCVSCVSSFAWEEEGISVVCKRGSWMTPSNPETSSDFEFDVTPQVEVENVSTGNLERYTLSLPFQTTRSLSLKVTTFDGSTLIYRYIPVYLRI